MNLSGFQQPQLLLIMNNAQIDASFIGTINFICYKLGMPVA